MRRNLGQTIGRAAGVALRVEKWILIWLLLLIVFVVFSGVIIRYFPINVQMLWVEEIARLCLVWLALWAAGSIQRTGGHFTFHLFKNRLKGRSRVFLELFINLGMLTFVVVLIREGITLCKNSIGVSTLNLEWPSIIFPLALVLCSLLLLIYCGANIFSNSRRLLKGLK